MQFTELFYKNPYTREFDSRVVSSTPDKEGFRLVLEDTAFYPEGGGQPSDTGVLVVGEESLPVLDVRREEDDTVTHLVSKDLPKGTTVHGIIDWEKRFSLMQNHTGEHIVSGLVNRRFGYENVGFHMGDVVTIDFSGEFSPEEAEEIEIAANRVVWQDLPVNTLFPEEKELPSFDYRSKKELSGKVRLISIDNADLCACCGLHVERTGEIGLIKILSLIRYKGGVRLEMVSGDKALADYENKLKSVTRIKNLLSVKPEEVDAAFDRVMRESAEKDEKIGRINRRYIELKTKTLEPEDGIIIDVEEDMNNIEIRKLCDALNKSGKAKVSLVLTPDEAASGVFRYCMASNSPDLKELAPELNKALNGKGGGSKEMIQGSFAASLQEITDLIRKKILR